MLSELPVDGAGADVDGGAAAGASPTASKGFDFSTASALAGIGASSGFSTFDGSFVEAA